MESGLQKLITADAGVSQLIATRLYPIILPDEPVLPSATYRVISRIEDQTLAASTGIFTARIQIDAWGHTYSDARALARAIDAALQAFADTLNDGPAALADGTVVSNIWLCDTPPDGYEPDSRLYFKQQDYKLVYTEPA